MPDAISDETHDLPTFEAIGLREGDRPTSFLLDAREGLCTPFGFLYGGSGIAASVEASERATGRPLQWVTTQFLGSPAPGDVVELEVDVSVEGRMTTQTQVHGRVDGRLVFTSLCAHNVRPPGDERGFSSMPDVPAPEDCADFGELFDTGEGSSFFDVMERRVAAGTLGHEAEGLAQDGPLALWCRIATSPTGSAATQAFVGDIGPLAVCATLGLAPGGTSLDNTIRVVDPTPSEWVLLELRAEGFARSVGHCGANLWSRDGRLLGLARQSAIIRRSHHDRPRP